MNGKILIKKTISLFLSDWSRQKEDDEDKDFGIRSDFGFATNLTRYVS